MQVTPYLFRPDFETKAKKRLEAVECLQKVSLTQCSKSFLEAALPTMAEVRVAFKIVALSTREEDNNCPLEVRSPQNVSKRSSLQAAQCPRMTDL